MICIPSVGELGDELAEIAPQALDLQPDHPVLEFDRRELGGELRRVAAALDVRFVDIDTSRPPRLAIGPFWASNRFVSSASRAAREWSLTRAAAAQQPPVLEKLDPGRPCRFGVLLDSGAAKAPLADRNP